MVLPVYVSPDAGAGGGIRRKYVPVASTKESAGEALLLSIYATTLAPCGANLPSMYAWPRKVCGNCWAETMAGILISRVVIATKTRNLVQVGFIGELSTTHLKLA
jgi:hypothetical protein